MLKEIIPKFHFIATLAMFLFIALMVAENDMAKRALLLLPVVICYAFSRVLFAMDQANTVTEILKREKRK